MTTKTWTVEVHLDEQGDDTFADAVLTAGRPGDLHGRGTSRRNPSDEAAPQIGDELAAARALSDLAHELLSAAAQDIEARTHEPVSALEL
jgi:hypothetical protein